MAAHRSGWGGCAAPPPRRRGVGPSSGYKGGDPGATASRVRCLHSGPPLRCRHPFKVDELGEGEAPPAFSSTPGRRTVVAVPDPSPAASGVPLRRAGSCSSRSWSREPPVRRLRPHRRAPRGRVDVAGVQFEDFIDSDDLVEGGGGTVRRLRGLQVGGYRSEGISFLIKPAPLVVL